jgi:hypothetical protein
MLKDYLLDPKRTWIPLAGVIAIGLSLFGMGVSYSNISNNMGNLKEGMGRIEKSLEDLRGNSTEVMKVVMEHEKRLTQLESTCVRK